MGSLFNSFGEMSGARFKGVTSLDDMLGWQSDSFSRFLKLNSDGISEYTMSEIKAKASVVDLTDELTAQAVALASDADFTAKAASGRLTYGKAIVENIDDIDKIGDALSKSGKLSTNQLSNLSKLSKGTSEYNQYVKTLVNGSDDIANSIVTLSAASNTGSQVGGKLANTFKGLWVAVKPLLQVAAVIGTVVAAYKAFDYATHGYTRAVEAANNASTDYSSALSELDSLNSKYDEQKAKIEELNQLKLDGSITMAQEVELANLQSQNAELERQIELQQSIVDIKQQSSAQAAKEASETEQSYTEAMQDKYGGFLGTLMGITGGYSDPSSGMMSSASDEWKSSFDNDTTEEGRIKGYISNLQDLEDELDAVQKKRLENPDDDSLEKQQQNIENSIAETKEQISESANLLQSWIDQSTDANGQITEGYETSVKSWRNALNEINNIGKSQEEIDLNNLGTFFTNNSFIESYLKGIVENGGSATDALEAFKNMGLSLSDLSISEDGFIRYFQDVKSSAEEAAEAVNSVDGSFEGVQAAFESENAGAEWTTMADYVTQIQDLYKSGKVGTDEFQSGVQYFMPKTIDEDAYKYDADAYVAAWESARKKIERYFDAENPLESMTNFTNDLIDAGKASQSGDDITWKFKTTAEAADALDLSVQSVEAAMHNLEDYGAEFDDVMFSGEGLERYESALENIKSLYDSMDEGESKDRLGGLIDNWDSELEKYQDDLSSLTEDQIVHIEFEYDLASIQQQIDQVMSLINNGDTSVENYAQVLAGNQQYIQTAESGVGFDTEGVKIPVEYVTNEDTISTLQEQLKSVTSEEEKIAIQAQIVNLQEVQKDLLNAFSDAHPEINAESSMDEINDAWNAFINGTDGANGKEIIANIVAKDDEAKQAVADLLGIDVDDIDVPVKADTSEAKRDINALVSEDKKTIVMDVNANTSDIEEALDNLQQGQTLYFTAKVDGKETGVAASFDETGEITYTANINDVEVSLDEVKDEEGNITYTADYDSAIDNLDIEATVDYLIGSQESPDTKEAFVDYIKNNQEDPEFRTALMNYLKAGQDDPDAKTALLDYIKNNQDDADDQNAIVNYFKGSQDNPDSPQSGIVNWGLGTVTWPTLSLTGIINWISGGGSRLSGTAHANGTAELFPIPSLSGRALAMGTLQDDSWLDPSWQTKHSEVALTGEEGQELVVTRANRWFTVGDHGAEFVNIPQGSIVFDAHQTKELLSKGRINSRGTAMIGGTAFANGWRLPSASSSSSSSSSSSKSSSSSGSSSTSSNSTSSTKSAKKAADTAKEAADEFEEAFDQIEILLDRMDRNIQKLTDSIETYSYDLSKQSAMSDKAMSTIRSNLTTLQSAYNRYIQEANSVGLSNSWISKIKNGSINIETITDEDLKNKIDEYQQWLRFSGHLIYFIAGTSPQPCFATT